MGDPISDIIGLPFKVAARYAEYQNKLEVGGRAIKEDNRAAAFADVQAVDALRRGAVLAGQARVQGALMAAKQKVAFTASGVDATMGTAAAVQGQTGMAAELDAQMASNNAFRAALGHREVARKYRIEAQDTQRAMDKAGTQFLIGAAGDGFEAELSVGSFLAGKP